MRRHTILAVFSCTVFFFALSSAHHSAHANTTALGRFPAVQAIDLRGDTRALPGGFGAPESIVVFSHKREHAEPASEWAEYITKYMGARPGSSDIPVHSVFLIDKVPKFIQKLISNGIRKDVPEENYAQFFIIYQKREPFLQQYDVDEECGVLILLVKQDGTTQVLSDRLFGDESARELSVYLADL